MWTFLTCSILLDVRPSLAQGRETSMTDSTTDTIRPSRSCATAATGRCEGTTTTLRPVSDWRTARPAGGRCGRDWAPSTPRTSVTRYSTWLVTVRFGFRTLPETI